MNNSQVALCTGEEVEENLSVGSGCENVNTHQNQPRLNKVEAERIKPTTKDPKHLHHHHVVGENVAVTRFCHGRRAPFPPLLNAEAEDEDVKRAQEKDVDDGEASEAEYAGSVVKAGDCNRTEGGIQRCWKRKGRVGGRVEIHSYMKM